MGEWKIPGVAVGAIRDGKVVLAKGYGYRDVARQLPVSSRTLMAIGSNSKSFTVTLMGYLATRESSIGRSRCGRTCPTSSCMTRWPPAPKDEPFDNERESYRTHVQFGEGRKYSDNQAEDMIREPKVLASFDAWTEAFSSFVAQKGKVEPGEFRAFGYTAPTHRLANVKLNGGSFGWAPAFRRRVLHLRASRSSG